MIRFFLLAGILFCVTAVKAQYFFKDVNESDIQVAGQKRVTVPDRYRTLSLDTTAFSGFIKTLPSDKNNIDHNSAPVIAIPLPDGTTGHFHIWESAVMQPGLAAKFPNIKTFTGQGIDDRTAVIKMDWTELGFHAMILSPVKTSVFITPYAQGNKTGYISYFRSDVKNNTIFKEDESLINTGLSRPASGGYEPTELCIGGQLRTYRLALACTHQYAIAATGSNTPTVSQTLSAIVTSINRVDGVYEEELDIHFVLVNNENAIIFTSASSDQFTTNTDLATLLSENQSIISSAIGAANYDIGHVFCTGGGGLTYYPNNNAGIVCMDQYKAMCATGLNNPTGDEFNIDYVAHEIGHEFGAYHSFNSSEGFCAKNGQWSQISNSEPGSGTTIMCYAEGPVGNSISLCGTDNLQVHSDPDFNALGFDEITQYTISGNGSSCATTTIVNNSAPVVNAGENYTIPLSTPFALTGSATDADGDALTYSWEEVDINGPEGQWDEPSGNAPIFRSFPPVTSPTRYFPQLSDVINNTTTIGEILPSYARLLHFRLTVRDNHAGGGGVCNGESNVTVDGSSGPFVVTYPDTTNIIWHVGETRTVTWNPANTQNAPVNCNNVIIELSTDGGLTYPDTLLVSTLNNGSAVVTVPNISTDSARIRVMAAGNIFYDVSNNNFTIQPPVSGWTVYSQYQQIGLSNNVDASNVTVELFDDNGRKVFEQAEGNVTAGQVITIAMDRYARGIYVLRINSNVGVTEKKILR